MRACIFGAGDYRGEWHEIATADLVIAADGGLLHAEREGLVPDLVIGDFDSLGCLPRGTNVITHPIEKDDTDMALAVKEALLRGADEIILFGALGGRLDHTLANITLLLSLARQGIQVYLYGDRLLTVLTAGESLLFEGTDGILSLFSLSEAAVVSLSGVKYPLTKGMLKKDTALGVSNHFEERTASVLCHSGELLVLWERGGLPKRMQYDITDKGCL